MMQFELR